MGLFDLFKGKKQPTTVSPNEKNPEQHKHDIEDYEKFITKVYLCASHGTIDNQISYVCINKETAELYSFTAKVIGRSGAFYQYVFSKQPQKIATYT